MRRSRRETRTPTSSGAAAHGRRSARPVPHSGNACSRSSDSSRSTTDRQKDRPTETACRSGRSSRRRRCRAVCVRRRTGRPRAALRRSGEVPDSASIPTSARRRLPAANGRASRRATARARRCRRGTRGTAYRRGAGRWMARRRRREAVARRARQPWRPRRTPRPRDEAGPEFLTTNSGSFQMQPAGRLGYHSLKVSQEES